MGIEVLEQGEEALIYKFKGGIELKKGPKRLWLVLSRLERLQRYTAKQDEYLKISHVDGKIEHKIGPCTVTLNTQNYLSISIEKCYCLDANQAIIIYKKEAAKDGEGDNKSASYKLTITKGPGIFMIQPDEWVHKFCWHGVDDENKTKYIAEKNKFEILNFAPNQLYYNVDEVRTSDDALIRIKLMIFYELKDIQTMLNETKDPIADFLNCCQADITSFTTQRTYLSFIESCHLLNNSETYPKLMERSKSIGFEITKVVFRGYFASPKLQEMHDNSIQARTNLKLQFESEMQNQEQLMINLKNNIERLSSEQDLEYQKLINQLEIEGKRLKNELSIKLAEVQNQSKLKTDLKLKELELISEKNQLQIKHMKNLKELDIDLNAYLLSSLPIPNKSVQVINRSIESNSNGDNKNSTNGAFTNLHFHD